MSQTEEEIKSIVPPKNLKQKSSQRRSTSEIGMSNKNDKSPIKKLKTSDFQNLVQAIKVSSGSVIQ